MTNYYEELGIDRGLSIEELGRELSHQQSTWIRRKNSGVAEAQGKLLLIEEAQGVFKDKKSRAAYDKALDAPASADASTNPSDDRKASFEKWRERARSFLADDKFDLARTSLEKALAYVDPDDDEGNTSFYALASNVYANVGDYRQSLDYANKAIVLSPEDPDARHQKAVASYFLFQKGYEDNRKEYTRPDPAKCQKAYETAESSALDALSSARAAQRTDLQGRDAGLLAWIWYSFRSLSYARAYDEKETLAMASEAMRNGDASGLGKDVIDAINKERAARREQEESARRAEEERKKREEEARDRKQRMDAAEARSKTWRNCARLAKGLGAAVFYFSIFILIIRIFINMSWYPGVLIDIGIVAWIAGETYLRPGVSTFNLSSITVYTIYYIINFIYISYVYIDCGLIDSVESLIYNVGIRYVIFFVILVVISRLIGKLLAKLDDSKNKEAAR